MSGWGNSDRRSELPPDWPARVRAVHRRSGWRCEKIRKSTRRRCGRYADGGVDHARAPDYHELDGLQDTCRWHHQKKTAEESQTARRNLRDLRWNEPEPHPGDRRT